VLEVLALDFWLDTMARHYDEGYVSTLGPSAGDVKLVTLLHLPGEEVSLI